MISKKMKAVISGAAAGTANGFFGAGGGLVLVPLFIRWLKLDQRKALATSVSVIMPLCLVSAAMYLVRTDLSVMTALPYLIGGAAGGAIGGLIFRKIPAQLLRRILALLIIYCGVRILL